ncbi:ras-related protein Rab-40B isoform X4 [Homo sapiens]|uniref:ras-related protein Rab-40B isoform X4 n=1 Tax=Homo sapiens TaxID=9606 RepID=UPI000387BA36|nr:ras-related protein Rab-40B isoform X4 [Homo sapiens]XP_054170750.1 ras-related protein Rab-40B isoform X4 [Homo sapiens]
MSALGSPVRAYDFLLKFLLVGDSDVGKGEILASLQDGAAESPYGHPAGIDYKTTTILLDGRRVKLQLWSEIPGGFCQAQNPPRPQQDPEAALLWCRCQLCPHCRLSKVTLPPWTPECGPQSVVLPGAHNWVFCLPPPALTSLPTPTGAGVGLCSAPSGWQRPRRPARCPS